MLRPNILFLFLFSILNQQEGHSQSPAYGEKFILLRTNPFSVLEKEGGIMLGANYRWHNRWSATFDPTLIFFSIHFNEFGKNYEKPFGIKIKSDIRYHVRNFILGFTDVFIGPEMSFGHVQINRTATFGINCRDLQCDYFMLESYREIKTLSGAALKMGLEGPVRKSNEHWKLEMYFGLGIIYYNIRERGIPAGGAFMQLPVYEDNLRIIREEVANLDIPAGLKISYRIH